MNRRSLVAMATAAVVGGCGGSDESTTADAAAPGPIGCAGPCPASKIEYLVIAIQENHTFDNHFGGYCKAPAGSNPTCNDGPTCCEGGPETDPGSGAPPTVLDDAANGAYSPDHMQDCELDEIDGGAMDRYVTGMCGNPGNFAYADPAVIAPYWDLAHRYALADRYFQPIAGASSSNDMYLARAGYVFTDNDYEPAGAIGALCEGALEKTFTGPTIGDLLDQRGVPWAFFAGGYATMAALGLLGCPATGDPDCPAQVNYYPCIYDPGDVPFEYYASTRDMPETTRDLAAFEAALAAHTLPAVSFVKPIGYETEHPGSATTLSAGVAFTTSLVDAVLASDYRDRALVLVTYDEGGGYFDHVAPPAKGPVDGQPYGTRVPLVAVGPFAKTNYVSHVTMEHASIVKFIEWNWLAEKTGQLGQRDTAVNNLGSLLDGAKTGVEVPD